MRLLRLLSALTAAVALSACVDDALTPTGGDAALVLAPEFSFVGGAGGLPITVIRLSPRDQQGTPVGQPIRVPVPNPDAAQFTVSADVNIGGRDSVTLDILVEMLSMASGVEVVEWSGLIEDVRVVANHSNSAGGDVVLIRGPYSNLGVDSVHAYGPEFLYASQSHPAWAVVYGNGSDFTVLWSSSDPAVVTVDAVGDSVTLHATGGGSAVITAAAGMHSSSFVVYVDSTTPGPVALVEVYPDSATIFIGSSRTYFAAAYDSAFIPVSATFVWQSLDPSIASVSASGLVAGLAAGRARIVASANGFADTAIAHVQALPDGVDIAWQGGAAGAPSDWFTADNWAPNRVPDANDVVFFTTAAFPAVLNANTAVGAILMDTMGSTGVQMQGATLTVHGDLRAWGGIYGDSLSRVVVDAPGTVAGFVPSLTIRAGVRVQDYVYVDGDIEVDGSAGPAFLDFMDEYFAYGFGDLHVHDNGYLLLGTDSVDFSEGALFVEGDVLLDGGDSRGRLTGGYLGVGGDFTVTATSCTAFVPGDTWVEMYSDTAAISIGCSGANGNRFGNLEVYRAGTGARLLRLLTDITVVGELYIDGADSTRVVSAGNTVTAAAASIYTAEFDRTHLHFETAAQNSAYLDDVRFTNMTGLSAPQLVYRHPGYTSCANCAHYIWVKFDSTSAGPYLELGDTDPANDTLIVYNGFNPGDGPARTVTTGGAVAHWADVPVHLFTISGTGQTGPANQPLPDSLVAEVLDWAYFGVDGVQMDWTVTAGDGSVSPTVTTTDSLGRARTQFTLGDSTFSTQAVVATTPALPGDTAFFYGYPQPVSGGGSPAGTTRAGEREPRVVSEPDPKRTPRIDRIRRELPAPPRPARTTDGRNTEARP